ncbi:MAG: phenylacetate--CoA ligase family protein [Thermoplasmata archaeon]
MKKIVRYAYSNVPAIKQKFRAAGLSPDHIKKIEDVPKIPFTTKEDFAQNYPFGLMAVKPEKIIRIHASSGTTGKPKVVYYTKKDIETWTRLMARLYDCAGVTNRDIVQNMYGYGLFTGGLGFHYGAERIGAMVIPASTGNTKRQIMLMKDFGTTVIASTPSYALYLCEAVKAEGVSPRKDLKLRIGLFGAEPWSEEARKKIQDTFGLLAIDCYGMSELYGPGVACECPEQNGLHVWGDEFYIETINPETGEVLEEGEEGEIVITMLNREAMPILRYRTRDLASVVWEECACGRQHPRIMRIKGRSDDMLIIGGVNVFPSQIEHVLMQTPELAEFYQILVTHDKLDRLNVQVELKPEVASNKNYDFAKLKARVESDLLSVLSIHANVEFMQPGTLPRTEGKAKRVIDMRKKE